MKLVVAVTAVLLLSASAAAAFQHVQGNGVWLKGALIEFLMPRR